MVSFSEVRRPELRDGAWRMGCSVGALVAWTCLPMKDWNADEDDEHERWIMLVAVGVGVVVLWIYIALLYDLAVRFIGWMWAE